MMHKNMMKKHKQLDLHVFIDEIRDMFGGQIDYNSKIKISVSLGSGFLFYADIDSIITEIKNTMNNELDYEET